MKTYSVCFQADKNTLFVVKAEDEQAAYRSVLRAKVEEFPVAKEGGQYFHDTRATLSVHKESEEGKYLTIYFVDSCSDSIYSLKETDKQYDSETWTCKCGGSEWTRHEVATLQVWMDYNKELIEEDFYDNDNPIRLSPVHCSNCGTLFDKNDSWDNYDALGVDKLHPQNNN